MATAIPLSLITSSFSAAPLSSHQPPNPLPKPIPPSPDPRPPPPILASNIPDPLPKVKWSELFASKPKNAGSFSSSDISLQFEGENLVITEDIIQAEVDQWQGYLVGFFLDSPLPYFAVVNTLRYLWKPQGNIDFKSNGSVYFFHFESLADRTRVLEADPLIIRNKLFIVKPWEPSLSNIANNVRAAPVWIKMYNIPLVSWSKRGICCLATRVGKFLCMDINTERMERLEYTKCMVELSAESNLPDSFPVRNLYGLMQVVKVLYLWKSDLCLHCKVFERKTEKCQNIKEKTQYKSGNVCGENTQKQHKSISKTGSQKNHGVSNAAVHSVRTSVPLKKNYWSTIVKKKQAFKYVVSRKEKGKQVVVDVSPKQRKADFAGGTGTLNKFAHLQSSLEDESTDVVEGEINLVEMSIRGEEENTNISETINCSACENEIEREENNLQDANNLTRSEIEKVGNTDPMQQIIDNVRSFESEMPTKDNNQATHTGFVALLNAITTGGGTINLGKAAAVTSPTSNTMIKPGFLNTLSYKTSEKVVSPTKATVPTLNSDKKAREKMNPYAHILPPSAYKPPPPLPAAASDVASPLSASMPGYQTRSKRSVQVVGKLSDND